MEYGDTYKMTTTPSREEKPEIMHCGAMFHRYTQNEESQMHVCQVVLHIPTYLYARVRLKMHVKRSVVHEN